MGFDMNSSEQTRISHAYIICGDTSNGSPSTAVGHGENWKLIRKNNPHHFNALNFRLIWPVGNRCAGIVRTQITFHTWPLRDTASAAAINLQHHPPCQQWLHRRRASLAHIHHGDDDGATILLFVTKDPSELNKSTFRGKTLPQNVCPGVEQWIRPG